MKYLQSFKNRHGKVVHYFRRRGTRIRLPAPGTADFQRAYLAAFARLGDASDSSVVLQPFRAKEKTKIAVERHRARKSAAGVYLLLLGNRVVYIGTSEDMATRVAAHRTNGRQFDRAYYIHAPGRDRFVLERTLIAAIMPDQNTLGTFRVPPTAKSLSHPPLKH